MKLFLLAGLLLISVLLPHSVSGQRGRTVSYLGHWQGEAEVSLSVSDTITPFFVFFLPK